MDTSCTIDIRNVETVPDQITAGDSPRNVIVDSPGQEEESPGHMVDLGEEEEDGLGEGQLVDVPSTLSSSVTDVNLLLLHSNGGGNLSLETSTSSLPQQMDAQTVQAVTLADGTTAFIQHPKGGKFMEGQTISLEDGSTAVVQGVSHVLPVNNIQSEIDSVVNPNIVLTDSSQVGGQPIQLEDGTTAFLHHTPKEGLQAIQLEDGTTAYITHPSAESLFGDAQITNLDSSTLSLDQLAAQVTVDQLKEPGLDSLQTTTSPLGPNTSVVHTVIAAGLTTDEKTMVFGEKAYRCSFDGCGRLYTTQHHLKVHERSHTGVRPFKCDYEGCGKAFATGYGLKSHTRVHTGEKPYKCPEECCDKGFKTSGDLQKHVRTHTGERPFKCPFEGCERSFTTSNIRKVHIRTHTGERPYICNEEGCGRAFASATNYKNHIRIHTGEKPYVCTVQGCGKRFTEYSSLYKHHVVHTHSKPYHCNHCGKTYRQTSTLAMHKRTAHGEDTTAEYEAQVYNEQIFAKTGEQPPEKRAKFEYSVQTKEEEGETLIQNEAVIINTESQNSQESLLPNDQVPASANIATITMGEHGQQQVFVITDPAQLEALQQLAAQQQQQQRENLSESSEQQLSTIGVGQTEEESQTAILTDQSGDTLTQLDPSTEDCVPKLEPGSCAESVVLGDRSTYTEKEILQSVTDADIAADDDIVSGGDIAVTEATPVLEETVQT
uniref:Zinc finger protein 76-like n=1 Tax=Crassostrea virginica TaxID=6565 RepID=A0A8B8C2A3_CRAVI|nr:zinc finger protein 76-like [Crassostrea virginica]XP_022309705.1 zinc finger protein 76-like [Crassostrea virginica]